jgi:hypothetical protein
MLTAGRPSAAAMCITPRVVRHHDRRPADERDRVREAGLAGEIRRARRLAWIARLSACSPFEPMKMGRNRSPPRRRATPAKPSGVQCLVSHIVPGARMASGRPGRAACAARCCEMRASASAKPAD